MRLSTGERGGAETRPREKEREQERLRADSQIGFSFAHCDSYAPDRAHLLPTFLIPSHQQQPLREAIEQQDLASKTKAASTNDKEGVNSSAERAEEGAAAAATKAPMPLLDPLPSSSLPPRPPTVDGTATTNNLAPAPSRSSLLERNRPKPPPDTPSQLELAVARFEALAPRLPPPPPLSSFCPGVYKKGGGSSSRGRFSQQQTQPTQQTQRQTQSNYPANTSFSDAGCDAPLEPCSYRAPGGDGGGGGGGGTLIHSWRCSTRPRCSYQETPPGRIAVPRLALEVVLAANFDEREEQEEKEVKEETTTTETETPKTTPPPPPLPLLRCLVPPPPPRPPSYELLVTPAQGAEDCVAFCGGVGAVLCALGLRGIVLQAEEREKERKERKEKEKKGDDNDEKAASTSTSAPPPPLPSLSLRLPLQCYERLEGRLLAARVARAAVLPASGRVPPGVLSALRGGGRGAAARPARPLNGVSSTSAPAPPDAANDNGSNIEESVEALFAKIPLPLAASLLPFQRQGVAFALRAKGRAFICDEMGVGKTLQALAAVAAYRAEWPALVVCPASLRLAWAEEAERWLPRVLRPSALAVVDGAASALSPRDSPDLVITSFEMLARRSCASCTRDSARAAMERGGGGGGGGGGRGNAGNNGSAPFASKPNTSTTTFPTNGGSSVFAPCPGRAGGCMAGRGWRVLVVDESHVLRTGLRGPPDARATEAAARAAAVARRAIFLTGTPSLSKPFDLWRQVDALVPGLLPGTRDAFAARYCGRRLLPLFGFAPSGVGGGGGNGGGGMMNSNSNSNNAFASSFAAASSSSSSSMPMRVDVSGLTHGRELAAVLRRAVMVRRLKSDVCAQLPPKRRQVVLLPRPRPGDWRKLARAATERGGGGGGGARGGSVVGGAGAGARKRKGWAGQQQQQQQQQRGRMLPPPPPPPLFSLAELAAAKEKQMQKNSKKKNKTEDLEPAFAFFDDEDDEEEDFVDLDDDENNSNSNDPNHPFQRLDPRSDAHRTALAKLPAVIEWLSTVFGCGGAGSSSAAASNYSSAANSQVSTSSSSTSTTANKNQSLPKIIIFAHHRDVMDALASALISFGVRYVRIDGSVDGADRRAAVEVFRAGTRGVRAALLSVTAAGTGLDFASASSVVFAELPDEPALVRQAEDRAHRRGREVGNGGKGKGGMPLNVYFLIAKGTSDERRWRALDAGLQRVAEALADEGKGKGGGGVNGDRRPQLPPSHQHLLQTPLEGGGAASTRRRFGSSFGGGGDARGLAVDRIREVHTQAATQAAAAAAAAASLLAAVRAPQVTLSTPATSSRATTTCSKSSSDASEAAPTPGCSVRARSAPMTPAAAAASGAAGESEERAGSGATPRTAASPTADGENDDENENPCASSSSSFPPFPRLVWFELSPHTSRLHFHGSPDGSSPLGLSVPLEAMASSSISSRSDGKSENLDDAVAVLSAGLVAPGGPCCPGTDRPLPPRETLSRWARDASELAGELSELRGVLRARVASAGGGLLRPPLTMTVAAAAREGESGGHAGAATAAAASVAPAPPPGNAEAENDGSGRGTTRHDAPRAPLPEVLELLRVVAVPENADGGNENQNQNTNGNSAVPPYSLLEVPVAGPGGQLRPYTQVFDASGKRLCLACGGPTPCQLPASAPLLLQASNRGKASANGGGRSLLFCGGRCDAAHAARTSASAARAALFRAERGVCCACGLDCHSLVRDLRAIEKEGNGIPSSAGAGAGAAAQNNKNHPVCWRRQRLRLILSRAPSFRGARAAAAAARLASSAIGGHAWQADHVLAVHRGGGSCGVGNLRTLCVPCHAAVTAGQARERARWRRREKRMKQERGGGKGGEGGNDDGDGDEEEEDELFDDDDFLSNGPPLGLQRALLLHAKMGAAVPRFIDDDEEEDEEGEEEEEEGSDDDEEEDDDDKGCERPPAARRARTAALLMPPPPARRPPIATVSPLSSPPRPLAELASLAGGARGRRRK